MNCNYCGDTGYIRDLVNCGFCQIHILDLDEEDEEDE